MTASVRIHPGESPTAAMLDGRMAIPEVIWLRAADPARGRKIGIRKAVGASVQQIVVLLTPDMARLVVLAALLAWPLAYGWSGGSRRTRTVLNWDQRRF